MEKRIAFALLLTLVFLFGCQRELLPEDADQPALAGAETTYDYSTNGFDMHVVVQDGGQVTVTSAVSQRPAQDGDEFLVIGPGAEGAGFNGTTFEAALPDGQMATFDQLDLPGDGATYWAVPFDPARAPVKLNPESGSAPIFGLSNCLCTGSPNPACAPQGLGCVNSLCVWCGRIIIVIDVSTHLTVYPGTIEPVALLEGQSILRNGVTYF